MSILRSKKYPMGEGGGYIYKKETFKNIFTFFYHEKKTKGGSFNTPVCTPLILIDEYNSLSILRH